MRVFFFLIFSCPLAFSQVYEIGLSYNFRTYVDESLSHCPMKESVKNFGIVFIQNTDSRFSKRIGINHISDKESRILDFFTGLNFNLRKYNLVRHSFLKHSTIKHSPYLILESSIFYYKSISSKPFVSIAVPVGLGYRVEINPSLVFSLETKMRIELLNHIFGILEKKNTFDDPLNSFYYFSTSIHYTFGWPKGALKQVRF